MSDNGPKSDSSFFSFETFKGEGGNVNIVYAIYLLALIAAPISFVGLIIANVNRLKASEWERCHYEYQIWTFWIALLLLGASLVFGYYLLGSQFLGSFLWFIALIWWVGRCISGIQAANLGDLPPVLRD